MPGAPFVKATAQSAAEVCARFNLPGDVKVLLTDGMSPREFVDSLIEKKKYVAGIDFLAHLMPPREAIWWGCLCFQHACGNEMADNDKLAARAAVHWILQPGEETRQAARVPADVAGPTPAGALARAVHQSGGNIAPPNMAPMPAPAFAAAKAVAMAVKLASTKADPARLIDTQGLMLNLGVEVAEGRLI